MASTQVPSSGVSKRCRRYLFTKFKDQVPAFDFDRKSTVRGSDGSMLPLIRYVVFQRERTNTGRLHYQGYLELHTSMRVGNWEKREGVAGLFTNTDCSPHLIPCIGTQASNIEYCKKKEGDGNPKWAIPASRGGWQGKGGRIDDPDTGEDTPVYEFGEPAPSDGEGVDKEVTQKKQSTSDVIALWIRGEYTDPDTGDLLPMATIDDIAAKYPGYHMRCCKTIEHCIRTFGHLSPKHISPVKQMYVQVRWGPAGTGKSMAQFEYNEKCFTVNSSLRWWDGYAGEEVLIIDEFFGQAQISVLLEVLDVYTKNWEIKGGHVTGVWTTVIITSNFHPNEWWTAGKGLDLRIGGQPSEESRKALMSRINSIRKYTVAGLEAGKTLRDNRQSRAAPERSNGWKTHLDKLRGQNLDDCIVQYVTKTINAWGQETEDVLYEGSLGNSLGADESKIEQILRDNKEVERRLMYDKNKVRETQSDVLTETQTSVTGSLVNAGMRALEVTDFEAEQMLYDMNEDSRMTENLSDIASCLNDEPPLKIIRSEHVDKIPDEVMNDPDKLIKWLHSVENKDTLDEEDCPANWWSEVKRRVWDDDESE
jgi:hypothetical protein